MKAFKLVIIVLALAVGLTSFNADAKKRKTTRRVAKKAKVVEPAPSGYDYVKGTNDNDEVLEVVEYMPEYPGGNEGLMKFLAQNIQYPEVAKKKGDHGHVVLQFIVEKDGSISNVKIVRSIFPSLDAEAERIITAMPKWIPGMQNGENVRVKYTIPISFSLGDVQYEVVSGNVNTDKNEYTEAYKNAKELRIVSGNKDEKPLFVVDDKIIGNDDITKIKPNDIESITVLKDESATKLYGEKGKNGVVIIKMKK